MKSVISTKHKPVQVKQVNGGDHARYKFANGYGASVINAHYAYGGLELAVLDGEGRIAYDTPITSDVEGYLDEAKLNTLPDKKF